MTSWTQRSRTPRALALAAWSALRFVRVRPWGRAAAGTVVVALLVPSAATLVSIRSPRVDDDCVVGADGATWRRGSDGGDVLWLLRDAGRGDGGRAEIVAAATQAALERVAQGRAQLIRPEAWWEKVMFDVAGRALVVSQDGLALVVHDPASPARPQQWPEEPLYERRAVPGSEISPFALIGPSDRGRAGDVDRVSATIAAARDGAAPPEKWFPAERQLLDALPSSNAWVAATARRFVREGGPKLYAVASRRE